MGFFRDWDFLFWARSKNPENPEKISKENLENPEKIPEEKSRKSRNPGVRDRDFQTSKKSREILGFHDFLTIGIFRAFLKIPGIFGKAPEFGIVLIQRFSLCCDFYPGNFREIPGIYAKFPRFGIFYLRDIPGIFYLRDRDFFGEWNILTKSHLWLFNVLLNIKINRYEIKSTGNEN